jgi:putative transposase
MARFARIVAPGCPHHVTARGNRREPILFEDGDQDIYCDILAEQMRKASVAVWSYCLMPNHVHLILCPENEDGLALSLGATHRRWANFVNARGRWRGHLFDGRFASVAMDEAHLMAAVKYVAMNPVRARLVERACDWRWSSVGAHLAGMDDGLVTAAPILERVDSFAALIEGDAESPPRLLPSGPPRRRAARSARRTSSPISSASSVGRSPVARRVASRLGQGPRHRGCCNPAGKAYIAPVPLFP